MTGCGSCCASTSIPSTGLFDAPDAELLASAAPYLVRFRADSRLLERVVMEGWSRRWGVFATSEETFGELRRALRRLLTMRPPANRSTRETLCFRFYDPAVLAYTLCDVRARQRKLLFAAVSRWTLEHADRIVMTFDAGDSIEQLRARAAQLTTSASAS